MEIELLEPSLYSCRDLDLNKYNIEINRDNTVRDKLENINIIKVYSYDYGGYQFGAFNEKLGDGRSGQFKVDDFLINIKGIGITRYTQENLDGYITQKELCYEEMLSYYLSNIGIQTVNILGYIRNKENRKKGLIRSNKTWIRLGMLHKYVMVGTEVERDSIRKCIKIIYDEENIYKCYKILINKWLESIEKILENRICHGSFSSDNLLIDGKILDVGRTIIDKKGTGNFYVKDREYYCFNNQFNLLKIYLEGAAPLFGETIENGKVLIEDLISIRESNKK